RYGATVIGMVRHHNACARQFLDLSHNFDVASLVHADRGIARTLGNLPGRNILLTNAPRNYARQVLETLGVLPQFDGLWGTDDMHLQGRLRPKPSLALMRQIASRLDVAPRHVILVEDTLRNLKSAHQTGMKTVHIHHPDTPFSAVSRGRLPWVDVRITALHQLTRQRALWHTPNRMDRA